jgi:hypothetical protein
MTANTIQIMLFAPNLELKPLNGNRIVTAPAVPKNKAHDLPAQGASIWLPKTR